MLSYYLITLRYFTLKSFIILCSIFCLLSSRLQAQESAPTVFPQVIAPSPTAAALGKYGEIPVSTYTGIPNIEIPFFTVQSGKLTLPISLSYHAGGIKIEDIASNVGLGWSLSAGGTITRTVRGLPDETANVGFLNYFSSSNQHPGVHDLTAEELLEVSRDNIDAQPDLFYFNFGSYSGSFVFNRTGICYPIPNQKLRFKPGIGPLKAGNDSWEVTTIDGTTFIFAAKEKTTTSSYSFNGTGISDNSSRIRSYVSSWYLTEIRSAGARDIITLEYETENITYNIKSSSSQYLPTNSTQISSYKSESFTESETSALRLSKIIFSQGSILINASPSDILLKAIYPREDLPGSSLIRDISLVNLKGNIIKKFILTHSYFIAGCDQSKCKRLRLDAVVEQGNAQSDINPPHLFEYNSEPLPPRDSNDQDHWGYYNKRGNSELIPQFETYVAAKNELTILPGGDKRPDPIAAQAGVLTRWTYPAGGSTKFEYELNEVIERELPNKSLAGKRIFTIIGNSATPNTTSVPFSIKGYYRQGQIVEIRYRITGCKPIGDDSEYNDEVITIPDNCAQAGILNTLDKKYLPLGYYASETEKRFKVFLPNGTYQLKGVDATGDRTYFVELKVETEVNSANKYAGGLRIAKITNYDGSNPAKDLVKEYEYNDENGLSTGRVSNLPVYHYNSYAMVNVRGEVLAAEYLVRTSGSNTTLGNDRGSYVGYGKINELHGRLGENGKSEYNYTSIYSDPTQFSDENANTFPFGSAIYSREWKRGFLTKKVEYKYVIANWDNRFKPVSETVNQYKQFGSHVLIEGVKVGLTCSGCINTEVSSFARSFFTSYGGLWFTPVKTIERTFDQQGSNVMENSQEFSYDDDNLQLKEQKSTLAPGWTITTKNTYPNNYLATGVTPNSMGTALRAMNSLHIHNVVVEKQVWQEKSGQTRLINGEINLFKANGLDMDSHLRLLVKQPYSTYTSASIDAQGKFVFDATKYYTALQYDRYDSKGNLLDVSKEDVRKAYLWGYGNTLPIAEASNAKSEQIAYTSFENANEGNWLYTASEGDGVTGNSYSKGTITTTNLLPVGTYNVSFWAKGSGTISLQGVSLAITATWTYYEKQIVLTTSTKVTLSAGTNQIDELRLVPNGAQMSTYVYKPLVGLTAAAAINNRLTYYSYDEMNRLVQLRDAEGNIVKDYRYHLMGKQASSPSDENNLDASFQFTSSALTGQTLTFTAAATGANLTYWWDLGAGQKLVAGAKSQQAVYALPGTYIVKLLVRNGNLYKTSSQLITIKLPTPPEPPGWTAPTLTIVSATKGVVFVNMQPVTTITVSATATGSSGTPPYQLYEWTTSKVGSSQPLFTTTTTTGQATLNFTAAPFLTTEEKKYAIKCRIKDSQNAYSEWKSITINEPN